MCVHSLKLSQSVSSTQAVLAHSIHPTACIDPSARIAKGVQIGPYVTVGLNSIIETGCVIEAHAVIGDYTHLGANNHIYSHAVVGSASQDLKHTEGSESWLIMGQSNRVREFVTINRATSAGAVTQIGDHNLLMAYAHVAHDCRIGNQVVLANGATLGGHVELADQVIIGAMSGIHQFVKIGKLTMIGAMSRVCNDVPPFMLVSGSPPKIYGLNSIGLRRQAVPTDVRKALKQAFQTLYRRGLNQADALDVLAQQADLLEIQMLIAFIQSSQRGLVGAAPVDWEIPIV